MRISRRAHFLRRFVLFCLLPWAGYLACAQEPVALPRSFAELRRLPAEGLAELPQLRFHATVTRATSEGSMVLWDGTDAIWCSVPNGLKDRTFTVGEALEVWGQPFPGAYAIDFRVEREVSLGPGTLPWPRVLTPQDLDSSAYDCHLIEVTGVVRAVRRWPSKDGPQVVLYVSVGGYRLRVVTPNAARERFEPLVDAEVRIRGICVHPSTPAGQRLNTQLLVREFDEIQVVAPAEDPRLLPKRQPAGLLRHNADENPGHRVRVRGAISAILPDEGFYLLFEGRGLRVEGDEWPVELRVGDEVECLGFPVPRTFGPALEDGVVASWRRGPPPLARAITPADVFAHDSELIRLEADLLQIQKESGGWRLQCRSGERLFTALLAVGELEATPGSRLALTGICQVEVGRERHHLGYPRAKGFTLTLREPADVAVLRRPPWWTPARLAAALGLAVATGAIFAAWGATVLWKNRMLRATQAELESARDQLADRVETRTGQLQEQIAARQHEALEFTAVNRERNRLARELHDFLEQTLAGAAYRLEAINEAQADAPEHIRRSLAHATTLLRQGKQEVRRTLKGLRPLALEHGDLACALRESLLLLTEGTDIAGETRVTGPARILPAPVEDALFRVAQEAIGNALKHAQPRRLDAVLAFEDDRVALEIDDDGRGFDPTANGTGPAQLHYGLAAMRERLAALGGALEIRSSPGVGTRLRATVPLSAVPTSAVPCPPPASAS